MEDINLKQDIKRFGLEADALLPRYLSQAGTEQKLELRDAQGNSCLLSELYPALFEQWRTIKSFADRKSVVYQVLDQQLADQTSLWQRMERFNDDRYAIHALELSLDSTDADRAEADYWNALARTCFILTSYQEAEQYCLKAMELDAQNIRTKRIYADILHLTERGDQAHQIYKDIIELTMPPMTDSKLALETLLGFDGNMVSSPIYAIAWLSNDTNISDEIWQWADVEFSYSPHFRHEHAVQQAGKRKYMEATAKLILLTREMPWYKNAVIHALELINQLHLEDHLPDDKLRLENLISANNWGSL